MEQINTMAQMLELMDRPGFCVKDGIIVAVNQAASQYLIEPGTPVSDLLETGKEDYCAFAEGSMTLQLRLGGIITDATVRQIGQYHIFLIAHDRTESVLQGLALAAKQLRLPLSDVVLFSEKLCDPEDPAYASVLKKSLYQLQRIVNNMSDAHRFFDSQNSSMTSLDLSALMRELTEKCAHYLAQAGITLKYSIPAEPVYTLADRDKLERTVFNLVSNAAKYAPKGSCVKVQMTRRENTALLSFEDEGSWLSAEAQVNPYERFLRTPTLEDTRQGLGLGLLLARATATAHGGVLLTENLPEGGVRVTMTLRIRKSTGTMLRSDILHVDYAGGKDRALLEFADILPPETYDTNQ